MQMNLCFCSCQSSVLFYLPSPSRGFLWPNLDKHLLLPDLSTRAAGLEVSSGIPWIISGAQSPLADLAGNSHPFRRKPVPSHSPTLLVIPRAGLYPFWRVLIASIEPGWLCYLSVIFGSDLIPPCCFHRAVFCLEGQQTLCRRCVRRRTALPLSVTMARGSVKPASLEMMLRGQFSPPLWVVPGTRWSTALAILYWVCRRFCCPVPSSSARAICIWG